MQTNTTFVGHKKCENKVRSSAFKNAIKRQERLEELIDLNAQKLTSTERHDCKNSKNGGVFKAFFKAGDI